MKKSQANQIFIAEYYGDESDLRVALREDWLAVQYEWSCFIDLLCKGGEITQQQYESWVFPWPRRRS